MSFGPVSSFRLELAQVKFTLLLVAGLVATSVLSFAQASDVLVDPWTDFQSIQANQGNQFEDIESEQGAMIGGWRRVTVENFDNAGETGFLSDGGVLDHTESSSSEGGQSAVIWDGEEGAREVPGDPNSSLVLFSESGGVVQSGMNTRGLADGPGEGVDLLAACGTQDDVLLALRARPSASGNATVKLQVFSADDAWSEREFSLPADSQRRFQILEFRQADFTGVGSAGGATFTDVGAFRLVVTTDSGDMAVDLREVRSCGYDFGSAPDERQLGDTAFQTFFYPTFSERVIGPTVRDDANVAIGEARGLVGAHHRITGPWLGLVENDTDAEDDGQPCDPSATSSDTCGDNADGNVDEDAVTLSSAFDPNQTLEEPLVCAGYEAGRDEYCVAVEVTNPTDVPAVVAGWIDFDRNGFFRFEDCNTSGLVSQGGADQLAENTHGGCERSAATIVQGGSGLSTFDSAEPACDDNSTIISDGSFATGNVPPNCTGTVVLVWDFSLFSENEEWTVTTDNTWGRFRVTTDTTAYSSIGTGSTQQPAYNFFSDTTGSGPVPHGRVESGEVEDHILAVGTIPVSINAFESEFTREGLEVSWGTASETNNQGFYIWGETRDGLELLTPDMIPSKAEGMVEPQQYTEVIRGVDPGDVRDLVITAVDNFGNEEMYGYYRVGDAFGRENPPDRIDWQPIRRAAEDRMRALGYEAAGNTWRRSDTGLSGSVSAVDVRVSEPGMQKVTHETLRQAGLDLSGVDPADIAVTLKGEGVPRTVELAGDSARTRFSNFGRSTSFGRGGAIKFWGERPSLPDALYLDEYVYRIEVRPDAAVGAQQHGARVTMPSTTHFESQVDGENVSYSPFNPNPNPWFIKELNANSGPNSYTATFDVDGKARTDLPARARVQIAGLTANPASPNHRIQVQVNGVEVEDFYFDGQTAHWLDVEVPDDLLVRGENTVSVVSPGGLGVNSITILDSVGLSFAAPMGAENNALYIPEVRMDPEHNGLRVDGFRTDRPIRAFGWTGESLYRIDSVLSGRGGVLFPHLRGAEDTEYWVSAANAFNEPEVIGGVESLDLATGLGELVLIAHPAFLPADAREAHPLNDYVAHREQAGWSVSVVDVTDIQLQYGGGMPLPDAVNNFLADAADLSGTTHVLLVGGDSFDYRDHYGLGSLSFIPTYYTGTKAVPHTPSDALLADLNGDGVSDLALGRWPVRTLEDLQATVGKVFDWESNLAADQSAVWLTDENDPRMPGFRNQVERLSDILLDAGWLESNIDQVIFEDVLAQGGGPTLARQQLFDALEAGRTLTGFSGHGSPTLWSFQGILTPGDVAELDNEGFPTLVGTAACYTSYFASPVSNTLAHRLMNGLNIDSAGDPVAAANGAVAIHGAATLSNYRQNEIFMRSVLESMTSGETLGESIRQARLEAADRRMTDLVVNWTLLGDPTLRMQQAARGR